MCLLEYLLAIWPKETGEALCGLPSLKWSIEFSSECHHLPHSLPETNLPLRLPSSILPMPSPTPQRSAPPASSLTWPRKWYANLHAVLSGAAEHRCYQHSGCRKCALQEVVGIQHQRRLIEHTYIYDWLNQHCFLTCAVLS